MRTSRVITKSAVTLLALFFVGCSSRPTTPRLQLSDPFNRHFETSISYPDIESAADPAASVHDPVMPTQIEAIKLRDLSLEEAISLALKHSTVVRDVGGFVLRAPRQIPTVGDPAIQATNPRTGVEAALSAFDATLEAAGHFENNDRNVNNRLIAGGAPLEFRQRLAQMHIGIAKTAATGTEFRLQQSMNYELTNAEPNRFPSYWDTYLDAEFRHPLLHRGGTQFNRVFGPQGTEGVPRGVLLARIDTDISIAQFEIAIRNLVSDVENTYWELYYAYRNRQILEQATRLALDQRNIFQQMSERELTGGIENYDRMIEEVSRLQIDLINSTWGVAQPQQQNAIFVGSGGVHLWERRLRRLMGIAINDGSLIFPTENPPEALVQFDWSEIQRHAILFRSELRRQKWNVKRTELELAAAKNFRLPELDLVARYRWRGYGEHLSGPGQGVDLYHNAFDTLSTGDFQEWQMGFEFSSPLGFRKGSVTVHNAELRLLREQQILQDQEHAIVSDLSASFAELSRSHQMLTYTRIHR